MKSAGLSSTYRNMLKRTTKITAHATLQASYLASKERQRALRLEAARAQFERQKREADIQASQAAVPAPTKD